MAVNKPSLSLYLWLALLYFTIPCMAIDAAKESIITRLSAWAGTIVMDSWTQGKTQPPAHTGTPYTGLLVIHNYVQLMQMLIMMRGEGSLNISPVIVPPCPTCTAEVQVVQAAAAARNARASRERCMVGCQRSETSLANRINLLRNYSGTTIRKTYLD